MPKKKVKQKKPSQRWAIYKASGNKLERSNKFCPKCGIGVFMAKHKDRMTCGKCGYVEFVEEKK